MTSTGPSMATIMAAQHLRSSNKPNAAAVLEREIAQLIEERDGLKRELDKALSFINQIEKAAS